MKALALVLAVLLGLAGAVAQAQPQNPDPCATVALEPNEVGLNYQGYCVVADNDGSPVQSLIVRRTETLSGIHITGILLVYTLDGWMVSGEEFVTDRNVENVQVTDSGYLLIDEAS